MLAQLNRVEEETSLQTIHQFLRDSTSSDLDATEMLSRLAQLIQTESRSPPSCDEGSLHDSEEQVNPNKTLNRQDIVTHVLNDWRYSKYSNCSLVHLAARYNQLDVLNWLKECCCDVNCGSHCITDTPEEEEACSRTYANHDYLVVPSPSYLAPSTSSSLTVDDLSVSPVSPVVLLELPESPTCTSPTTTLTTKAPQVPPNKPVRQHLISRSAPISMCSSVTSSSEAFSPLDSLSFLGEHSLGSQLHCSHDPPDTNPPTQEEKHHSVLCKKLQGALWNVQDNNGATPLYYAVTPHNSKKAVSMEALAFLLTQPVVQKNQLNHHHDNFGNTVMVIAIKNKLWEVCEMLKLFGGRLEITIGIGTLGESPLHAAFREKDTETTRYLSRSAPKMIMKRNQKDECALFACLRDYRSYGHFTTSITRGSSEPIMIPSDTESLSSKREALVRNGSLRRTSNASHANFLKEILTKGSKLFGKELFEKALASKNSYGRNILMESIALGDIDSTKTICIFLSQYCGALAKSEELVDPKIMRSFIENLVFDKDKQSKNILHLSVDYAIIRCNKNSAFSSITEKPQLDDFSLWMGGFNWLLQWLEANFHNSHCSKLPSLFALKDYNSLTVMDKVKKQLPQVHGSFDSSALEWPRVLEILKQSSETWSISVMSPSTPTSSIRKNFSTSSPAKMWNVRMTQDGQSVLRVVSPIKDLILPCWESLNKN